MGFADINLMSQTLRTVKDLNFPVVGTLTLDTYTRQNKKINILEAKKNGLDLNGFPLISYPSDVIKEKITSLIDKNFLIQVRHGSPLPYHIFKSMVDCGLSYTEGGPISYCLPYGRIPLRESIESWEASCQLLTSSCKNAHIESFAGCMLGQLCPPSLLIAFNILEGLFFVQNGFKDISISYAQYYNSQQDLAAIRVLKKLTNEFLCGVDWHLVVYTFMGLFPKSEAGWKNILKDSVLLSNHAEAKRLIVKTKNEAFKLPTFQDNLEAINKAHYFAQNSDVTTKMNLVDDVEEEIIYYEARTIIESVLNLSSNLNQALCLGFKKGLLDIPFCLHPDNTRQTSASIDNRGYLYWINTGSLAFKNSRKNQESSIMTSSTLMNDLNYNRNRYDKT